VKRESCDTMKEGFIEPSHVSKGPSLSQSRSLPELQMILPQQLAHTPPKSVWI